VRKSLIIVGGLLYLVRKSLIIVDVNSPT